MVLPFILMLWQRLFAFYTRPLGIPRLVEKSVDGIRCHLYTCLSCQISHSKKKNVTKLVLTWEWEKGDDFHLFPKSRNLKRGPSRTPCHAVGDRPPQKWDTPGWSHVGNRINLRLKLLIKKIQVQKITIPTLSVNVGYIWVCNVGGFVRMWVKWAEWPTSAPISWFKYNKSEN